MEKNENMENKKSMNVLSFPKRWHDSCENDKKFRKHGSMKTMEYVGNMRKFEIAEHFWNNWKVWKPWKTGNTE